MPKSKGRTKQTPLTAQEKEWEEKLAREGMPSELKPERNTFPLADLARIGRKNRPAGYDHDKDIFAEGGPLHQEDTEQCDSRLGLEAVKNNPELLKKRSRGGSERKG